MVKNKDFNFEISFKKNQIEFNINTKIYSLTAVYQTAYLFLDKVYIYLDGEPKKNLQVVMKLKEKNNDLEEIVGDFYNELLNQLLREKINQSNAKVREFIVAKALYNAVPNEVDELLKEVEEEDWQDDPLGIAQPWEDQDKKDKEKDNKKK